MREMPTEPIVRLHARQKPPTDDGQERSFEISQGGIQYVARSGAASIALTVILVSTLITIVAAMIYFIGTH